MPLVPADDAGQWKGIWVVAETQGGELAPVTRQLLGAAVELGAKLDEPVALALMGSEVTGLAAEAARYGAGKVYVADHPCLAKYTTLRHAGILAKLILQERPSIVLLGATCMGRDLAPRVAARVQTGLTADAIELRLDDHGRFLQICPGFGGNLLVDIYCPHHRPQMVTVRTNAFATPTPTDAPAPEVVSVKGWVNEFVDPVTIIERQVDERTGEASLADAKVIVGGGRGLRKRENFERLYELAELLGGAVAATRALVDEGWAPPYCQIGQTGLTVQPKLYLAFGISGAVQHVAGVRGAETIIAVNTDARAPIFDVADYGFVADAPLVLDQLISRLRARRGGEAG